LSPEKYSTPGVYKKYENLCFSTDSDTKDPIVLRYVHPEDVRDQVYELTMKLGQLEKEGYHAIQLATIAHYNLARIHPFGDGNGRLARILMNLMFLRRGFNPAVIHLTQKEQYMECLAKADRCNVTPLAEFVAECLTKTQETLLALGALVEGTKR